MAVGERQTFRTEELEERPTYVVQPFVVMGGCKSLTKQDLEFVWWGTACGWQLQVATANSFAGPVTVGSNSQNTTTTTTATWSLQSRRIPNSQTVKLRCAALRSSLGFDGMLA